jgi:RHS repeat-associated protein
MNWHQLLGSRLARGAVALLLCAAPLLAPAQTVTYFHNDAAGTPLLATDAAGAVVWKESYQPYGGKLNNQAAALGNKIGFAGKPYDNASGLAYAGARYYDPVLGRFMGVDPAEVEPDNIHGFNRYTYANNNPYKFVDPDGRAPHLIDEDVGGGRGGGRFSEVVPRSLDGGPARLSVADTRANLQAARAEQAATNLEAAKGLPDSALVCRGGACKAESFLSGSGVTRAADGTLSGVSTQSRAGASVNELAKPFKNNQVGVTTAGDIRAAGGRVTADGHPGNPNHATVNSLTPQQLERLFSPTVPNPVPPGLRGF